MTANRWVKFNAGPEAMIAYVYVDQMAGPSAKGGPVSDPPTRAEIDTLLERPPATFRDPMAFGAQPLDAATVTALGLPDAPPWMAGMSGFK